MPNKNNSGAAVAVKKSIWESNAFLAWIKRNLGPMVALLFMCILLTVATDTFLVPNNLLSTKIASLSSSPFNAFFSFDFP